MATDDKLIRLQAVPLFSSCSKAELRRIAALAEELRVPAGKTLVRQGAVGRELFLLIDGEVQVSRNGQEVAVLGPGSFFGELSLLAREPRDASVTTLSPSVLLVIGQREFGGLLESSPALAVGLLEGMARRLRQMDRETVHI